MEKELWIVPFPPKGTEEQYRAAQRLLAPLAEQMGLIVMVSQYAPAVSDPVVRMAQAVEANSAAVLELCGLVAASFEQEEEPDMDAPGASMTINGPRRRK